MLTVKQIKFAHAVAEEDGRSQCKCAIDSGYAEKGAADMAYHNMRNAEVQAAIEDRKAQLAAEAGVTRGLVIREWLQIATADPSELVSVRVVRCPECWPALPDRHLPPNPHCPACIGEGVKLVSMKDTKELSPGARRLFAGAKQTKDGIEIKMRDQGEALRNLADYLGMQNKGTTAITGPGGGPMQLLHANAVDLTDAQLEAIAAAALPPVSANLGVSEGVLIDAEPLSLPSSVA